MKGFPLGLLIGGLLVLLPLVWLTWPLSYVVIYCAIVPRCMM